MKKVTFCLVCGATSPVESRRCQNCNAPLADKKRRRKPQGRRIEVTPLTILVVLAVVAVVVAIVVGISLG